MPQPPAPVPQAVPAGKKPANLMILLLVLGGLFVVAVALILFFALKH
jgi:flagellar basal body-associated protein FliL